MPLTGKISSGGFDEIILPRCGRPRSEVLTGPAFGVDVSLVELPNGLGLAMTSDPLSLIPSLGLQESAWLSVHLMANDMATTGFAPQYAQMVLNLPEDLPEADLITYWDFVHQYCNDVGVAITGGHTGRIPQQNSTIAGGGTMLLTAPLPNILISHKARAGDVVLVTKDCAMSSAAILAMSFPETVKNKLGKEVYDQACGLFYQTSSLKDALTAAAAGGITAMHDVTEGGVLGAVYEMAIASGNGVSIDSDLLPLGTAQQAICGLFGIDSRFCVGAGSMVMSVNPEQVQYVIQYLQQNNIKATAIGTFTDKTKGYTLTENGVEKPMPYHATDPYWGAFFNAYKNGWK
ncbi:AIR synthase-related protein [Mucilaginibacter ginsenosidivorax]|uniref:AIR synthase n=1 Tax=Mucilaginibacter ginsenosidivorax TaxID=862126 RepID=A0A5B8W5I8_9SPHI|nr:AIR synthase-related protein [Mucilaginibacter ginsenosidivorax]QEC78216.1 AIR synthase [Mucilaginibacter ginsenosidivorax]